MQKGALSAIECLCIVLFVQLLWQLSMFSNDMKNYFLNIWNSMDFFILAIGYGCVIIFYKKEEVVMESMKLLDLSDDAIYISFYEAVFWQNTSVCLIAFLAAISTIRLWKFFRFSLYFRIFENAVLYNFGSYLSMLFGKSHLAFL